MTNEKIWLSAPHLTGDEIRFVQDAFNQNWVSPYGSNIEDFEKKLEAYFGVPDAVLVNSGTAAIHLSLLVSDIKDGDEVIVPTLNFAGCINPILYQRATPIFIDSEPDTWNIDPNIAEDAIKDRISKGKKPKAILAVHLFGTPCKMDEVLALGKLYDIPVIEDAADALASTYKGKKVGTLGKLGIISFNGNKIITTSAGGLLISDDVDLIAKAKHLSNQARNLRPHYVHDAVGYNYMMSNILAGIGLGQFDVLDDRLAKRRAIFNTYKTELAGIEEIEFVEDVQGAVSNRWLSTALIHSGVTRDNLYDELAKCNIESRPVWNPMHMQPPYEMFPYYGNDMAATLFEKGICLPSGSNMSDAQLEYVVSCIKQILSKKLV